MRIKTRIAAACFAAAVAGALLGTGVTASANDSSYSSGNVIETVVTEDTQDSAVSSTASSNTSSLGVAVHTQAEIINHIKASGATLTDEISYKTAYSTTSPYAAGELSDDTLNMALAMLNNVRYIAGLSFDITLDEDKVKACQTGALVNAVNNDLDHYPTQPSDMSDELYELGYSGTSNSNISYGYSSLGRNIVFGWMGDYTGTNVERVGHRAWCLEPTMGKTGFGVCGKYSCMYVVDYSGSGTEKNIAWPAQNMPVEYFNEEVPWSLFTGNSEASNADNVVVTLTRKSDNKVWTFSNSSADGDFHVLDRIQDGVIIFRPSDITGYEAGDVFTVSVTGIQEPVTYTVNFFSLGDELGHEHTYTLDDDSVAPDLTTLKADGTMSGKATIKCSGCSKTWSADSVDVTVDTDKVKCGLDGLYTYDATVIFGNHSWKLSSWSASGTIKHTYGDPTFSWDSDSYTCTATETCTTCGSTKTTACTITSAVTTQPTCETTGVRTYTAEYGENKSSKTEVIAATGHTEVTDVAVESTCTKTGLTEGSHCSVCGEIIKVQEVIAATGHTAGSWQVAKKATTSADGSRVKKCTVCGQTVQTQKIAKTFVIKPKATGIRSLTNTAKGVKLTWSKAASGTGYVVYRKTNSGAYKKVKTISSIKTVSFVDTGAKTNGTKYTYKVYVYKKVGSKSYTSAASAAKATYYVKAPAWKKLANTSSRKATVKYAKNTKASGYQIQYATKKTFAGKKTITVKKTSTTSAVIKSLKKGKTYYVRVRSYKRVKGKTYYSAWNTVKKVVVKK